MKLALGTAQFGLDYGISNTQGQVCPAEVNKILNIAQQHNINTLDTAPAYGNSELVIGKSNIANQFKIISKIPALKNNEINIERYIKNSLSMLKTNKLDAVLFHHVSDIISHPLAIDRFNTLLKLKEKEVITKVGISVYTPEQLKYCVEHYQIDIVQLPLNCLDQRFIQAGWLDKLASKGIEVHCRSLFLQGLLLMAPSNRNNYFSPFSEPLNAFINAAKKFGISPLTLALAIACQQESINKIVLGCCNNNELKDIIHAYKVAINFKEDLSFLACSNEKLLIASNWELN